MPRWPWGVMDTTDTDMGIRITDMAMAIIPATAITADTRAMVITADIEVTTEATGAMGVG
jgi:hypothetical protein